MFLHAGPDVMTLNVSDQPRDEEFLPSPSSSINSENLLWLAGSCRRAAPPQTLSPNRLVCDWQHIGLDMFSPTRRPKRIYQMTHGVLNLPRNFLLDWMFGHSLINCHVEHHLFPFLSDHMCLKVARSIFHSQLFSTKEGYWFSLRASGVNKHS